MIVHDITKNKNKRLLGQLAIATIPTFIIGFLFSAFFEKLNDSVVVVIIMLVLVGTLMVLSDRLFSKRDKEKMEEISYKDARFIGLAQVVALIPGTSRSGITILAGNYRKLTSSVAAEFSFMLAIPTILGAIMHSAISDGASEFFSDKFGLFLLGNLVSFISGLLSVSLFIRILKKYGLKYFGYYRIGLATVLTLLIFATIIPV